MKSKVSGSAEPTTTYLLMMKDGTKQRVTVPTSYKVTFGPLTPGSKDGNGSGATSLRFYADQQHQKACFTNVESFRDMSFPIEEEVTRSQEETFYKDDVAGGERKAVVMEARVKEWINPDAPRPQTAARDPKILITNEMKI